MSKRESQHFRLPGTLTLPSLKQAFADLSLVARSTEEYHMLPELRSASGTSLLEIDASDLSFGTPEAMASLAALIQWLRDNPVEIKVNVLGASGLRVLGLDPTLASIDLDPLSDLELFNSKVFLPVRRIRLPGYCASPGDPRWNEDRASIQVLASKLSALVKEALAGKEERETIHKTIAEFLWEGLLNVQEHSYGDETPDAERFAWICAAIYDPATVYNVHQLGSIAPSSDEKGWLYRHYWSKAKYFLEIAVVDIGVGIPGSLGNAFLKKNAKIRRSLSQKYRTAYWDVHDEILRWALSPYGSRKSPKEYETSAIAAAWRGLYRVLYRSSRCEGALILRSGFGMIGAASFRGISEELRLRDSGVESTDLKPWPWTTLVLRLALPYNEGIEQTYSDRTSPVQIGHRVSIPVSYRSYVYPPTEASSDNFEKYASGVKKSVKKAFERSHTLHRHTEEITNQLAVIEHPAVSLGRPSRVLSIPGLKVDDVEKVMAENREAAEMLAIIGRQACPGIIPVHLFVDLSEDGLEMAQEMFADSRDDGQSGGESRLNDAPSIVGVARVNDRGIIWFISVTGSDQEVTLAATGKIARKVSEPSPNWIVELATLYPGVIQRVDLPDRQGFELRLPSSISAENIRQALNSLLPALASEKARARWYWRAQNKQEFVLTGSGHHVREYVSAFALCVNEPIIEGIFSSIIRNHIVDQLLPNQRALVIPASETSSYLLAKRIVQRIAEPEGIIVVHPSDLEQVLEESDRIFIFADIVYTGSSIERRLSELRRITERDINVIACLDLHNSENAELQYADQRIFSVATWPFPPPEPTTGLGKDAKIYIVDPLTNELLDEEIVEESKAYCSIIWRNAFNRQMSVLVPEKQEPFLRSERFEYGFQVFGERLHVVRYPVSKVLGDSDCLNTVVEWICRGVFLEGQVASEDDVVIFVRDESSLWTLIVEIREAVIAWQQSNRPAWTGRLFVAPVLTTRHGDRQFLRYDLTASLDQAVLIKTDPADLPRQPLLFSSQDKISNGFHAAFIDNGSITGRAIRDFALALARAQNPYPSAVHLLPIVDKLSPSEERLLIQVPFLRRDSRNSQADLRFYFHAFVQLRIRSYKDFESTTLFRLLSALLERAKDIPDIDLYEWCDHIDAKLRRLREKNSRGTERYPLCVENAGASSTSVEVIYLRHLISVYQQGLPVLEELIKTLRKVLSARDYSLLTTFALEPDLLVGDVLLASFVNDIAGLAFECLGSESEIGLRSNALWILFLQRTSFIEMARALVPLCIRDSGLWLQFMALALAGLEGEDRQRSIEGILEVLRYEIPKTEDSKHAIDLLRAESYQIEWGPPKTRAEARETIYRFLRESRARHGDRGFPTWWRIHNICVAIESDSSYVPTPAEHSEHVWDQAAEYLSSFLVPTLQSLPFLVSQKTKLYRTLLPASVRDVRVAFEEARRISQELTEGKVASAELASAWDEVCWNSLQSSADLLLGKEADCIMGEATLGSVGFLDHLIPQVVLEPLALLYHTLSKQLGDDRECITVMSLKDGTTENCQGSIDKHLSWLFTRWGKGSELPLFWADPEGLRQCYKIMAENILVHGAKGIPVESGIALGNDELILRLKNRKHRDSRVGGGHGLPQIRTISESFGGRFEFTNDPKAGMFALIHSIPIKWLQLPPLGGE